MDGEQQKPINVNRYMESKVFTKEAVEEALRLTAMGCCGILSKENAEEALGKLPEDLSRVVMATTISVKMIEQDLKSGKSILAEILRKICGKEVKASE